MRALLFCLTLFAGTQLALAQKSILVNNLTGKDNLIKSSFAYEVFSPGKVIFKNNTIIDAQLNYSRLTEQVVFIDEDKKVIMALGNPETIAMVAIGNDIYRYNPSTQSYVVKTSNYPDVNLNARIKCKLLAIATAGAYGTYTNSSAVQSVGAYGKLKPVNASDGSLRYAGDEKETYTFAETFYLSNTDNIVYADKKGFNKMFPKHDKEFKDYMASNKIDLLKRGDVEKLLEYAQSFK